MPLHPTRAIGIDGRKKVTRSSTTEVTPSGEHSAEVPPLAAVDDKPLQKNASKKADPTCRAGSAKISTPATDEPRANTVATDRPKRAAATAKQCQGAGEHVLCGT
jgi:hypothetical protein